MQSPRKTNPKANAMIGALIFLFVFISCSNSPYSYQYFSFPPESLPHETQWEFLTIIIVSSKEKPLTKKSKKTITIKAFDQNENILLLDNLEFNCASVRSEVVWEKFEVIEVELFEVGNKFAKNQYNKELMDSGPRRLVELKYQFDKARNKFKRSETG